MKIEIDDNHIDLITQVKKTSFSVEEIINEALHDHIAMLLLDDVDQVTLANLRFKAKRIGKRLLENGRG